MDINSKCYKYMTEKTRKGYNRKSIQVNLRNDSKPAHILKFSVLENKIILKRWYYSLDPLIIA